MNSAQLIALPEIAERRTAMTALDFTTGSTRITHRPALLVQGLNAATKFYRAWRNRREFYRLGELTDAELKDIGLTRADLYIARTEPLGVDPTAQLRSVVASRLSSI
jgi:uncharacterized protein YjiS (DUF1127 family)